MQSGIQDYQGWLGMMPVLLSISFINKGDRLFWLRAWLTAQLNGGNHAQNQNHGVVISVIDNISIRVDAYLFGSINWYI